ncbi:MAG: hypothetical protein L6R37_002048 [Teloschistes peruensis]|nr:MAG: hypothetical protein L6R37_002048 [Teloschistes peruensis]
MPSEVCIQGIPKQNPSLPDGQLVPPTSKAYCVQADNFVRIAEDQISHTSRPGIVSKKLSVPAGQKVAVEAVLTGPEKTQSIFAAKLEISAQTSDTSNNVQTWRSQRGFYLVIAALPLSFAVYKFSRSSDDSGDEASQPWFTRMIRRYDSWQRAFGERNALHTNMLEQAGHDRNLFYNSPRSEMIDLSFPEIFNTGSPYNVPAGHGANLDELIAHYKKKNAEQDAKVRARMERWAAELRPEKSATLSGQNPAGAPPYSTVTPTK